jgi:hypothetical protein
MGSFNVSWAPRFGRYLCWLKASRFALELSPWKNNVPKNFLTEALSTIKGHHPVISPC